MGKPRRQYSEEFKREAVELTYSSGKQAKQDLGISKSVLTRWRAEAEKLGDIAFPGKGRETTGTPEEKEIRRLKRELTNVKKERDILRKSHGHLHSTPEIAYEFIHEHRFEFRVEKMYHVLGVSRSGYYAWRAAY